MSHATVLVIADAGRSDYVRPETMPFLHGLAQEGLRARFDSPPGFAQRTVLFTGRYPDTSGNFSAFVYDPDASPFRWTRALGPLGSLVRPRRALFPLRMGIKAVTKWATGAYHTDPAWIPPRFLPFFRPCEDMRPVFEPGALGAPSLFDLCRGNGLRFRYLAHPVSGDDDEVHRWLLRDLRSGAPHDFYVAQFSAPDEQGHVHGPASPHMQTRVLRDLDARLASIHAALAAGYDAWDLLVVGDHGMAPVRERVDVQARLGRLAVRPGRDYVLFVNSTLAVLWYLTERGERTIEDALASVPGARPVSAAERERLRIPRDRRWGDRMLAAEPGVLFWPDYFHVVERPILGMHGYLDKRDEGPGLGVLASSRGLGGPGDVGERSLVDVFPTLCQLLGLPVPSTQEGQSLLPRRVPAVAIGPSPLEVPAP